MKLVRAKKNLGQHFLTDNNIAQDIVNALSGTYTNILEVGAGMGILTKILLEQSQYNTHVVEIDGESVVYLQKHFPSLGNRLWHEDFLQMNFEQKINCPFALIGNFPYNISSQILFKVLDNKELIPEVVGMFQKEVAQRIASKPNNKDYGILSVLLQAYYDIEYLFTVHENVFNPPPKVKSAVIRLKRNNVEKLNCDEQIFKFIVKTAFNQRRKMLRNSLKNIDFDKDFFSEEIFNKRPENLSVEDYVFLSQNVIRTEL